jgi:hypothetical protein
VSQDLSRLEPVSVCLNLLPGEGQGPVATMFEKMSPAFAGEQFVSNWLDRGLAGGVRILRTHESI